MREGGRDSRGREEGKGEEGSAEGAGREGGREGAEGVAREGGGMEGGPELESESESEGRAACLCRSCHWTSARLSYTSACSLLPRRLCLSLLSHEPARQRGVGV